MFKKSFSQDEWNVVKARIDAMPANLRLSIGGVSLDKVSLMKHIDDKDEIGELLVKINFSYLRSFKQEARILSL